jgi:predicted ABC-type ATPase
LPSVLIIAGPNGAGKTTFVRNFWPEVSRTHVFVNADEIARELAHPDLTGSALDLAAGRKVVELLDRLTVERRDMLIETTLTTVTYARRIAAWRASGYRVKLAYIRLPDVEASIARVTKRVSLGGHGIPEPDLRRRFQRSLDHLENTYKPIVDEWKVYADINGRVTVVETSQ